MSGAQHLILAGLGLAMVNAGVKFASRIPPYEILFFRAVISIVLTYLALQWARIPPLGNNKPMLLVRGLVGTFGLLFYFYTLQSMPFATAVTLQYLHPIFTGVVAGYALKEQPTKLQWLLLAISFLGVLLVRGFDSRVSAFGLLIAILSALLTSVSFTLIRALRREDHALVVMFYLPVVSLAVLAPFTLFHWVTPHGMEWAVIAGIGVLTQVAQYLLTRAYHLDTAANISNLGFLGIVYALVLGIVLFGEPVRLLPLIGMGMIVASAIVNVRVSRRTLSPSQSGFNS